MKHTDKKKLARKLQTPLEQKLHVPLFDSKAWQKRKEARQKKVISKYMSDLGKKGFNATLSKDPQHLEKMRANSIKARQKNKEFISNNK